MLQDLAQRSDDKAKGVNKFSFLEVFYFLHHFQYTSLPGILADRLFQVFDSDKDDYLNAREFITGLLRIYCSTLEQKTKFIFEIYDFDNDGWVS